MDPQALETYLRAHTPGEDRNLGGHPFDFHVFPEITIGKEKCRFLKLENNQYDFGVRRNSRFQSVPLHAHDWIELNYMYSGHCLQTIGDQTQELHTHQISLIDSMTPHALGYTGEDDILLNITISRKFLTERFFNRLSAKSFVTSFFIDAINNHTDSNHYLIFHSENSRRIPLFMDEFLCESFNPSPSSPDILESLIVLIISELIHVFEKDMRNLSSNDSHWNTIIPVLHYIERNYASATLEGTAAFFNMNPNYLTTLLKQQTGRSYKELILQQRMRAASNLLLMSNISVTEIAHSIGYENVSFFYQKFADAYGCTPKAYREQKR